MTKATIIDAAFRVWGRNCYGKTSLSQLAGELGVSKPALYRHFKNKKALTAAMTEYFLDDFAASIRADFEKAKQANDADDGICTIIQSISGYFAQNVYTLIFCLINIYERNFDGRTISECLKTRGVDMGILQLIVEKKYSVDPSVVRLIFATLTFFMSPFHKDKDPVENPLSLEEIQNIISTICEITKHGLEFSAEKTTLDFEKLEEQINGATLNTEPEPLFKAVAEAVAEAGPWDTSMDMVAKKLGLSKSSLYGHFKNRKDMLRRLFLGEFKRMMDFARQGIRMSVYTEEQLYLGIFSIAVYFRSRPEILITMDWIRTRKLDLGKPKKQMEFFRLFEDVDIESMRNCSEEQRQHISHWILFLLINILSQSSKTVQNNYIRLLYKFITLGLGGFIR